MPTKKLKVVSKVSRKSGASFGQTARTGGSQGCSTGHPQ
jgi:hypothetical protein